MPKKTIDNIRKNNFESEPKVNNLNKFKFPKLPKFQPKFRPIKFNNIKQPSHKGIIFIIFSVIFIIFLYMLTVWFAHATIYITAKQQQFTFTNEPFTASHYGNGDIAFELMIVPETDSMPATFTQTSNLVTYATGTVMLYNSYSTKSQKISSRTKLLDNTNHIYYTDKAVTIPGYTTVANKIIPGSVSVSITASAVGMQYNEDPTDFTLVEFSNTTKATKIYARSSTPITGGQNGTVYSLTDEDKGTISTQISTDIHEKLERKLEAQVPPGYIMYPGSLQLAYTIDTSSLQSTTAQGNVTATGSLSAILLKQDTLQQAIIKDVYNSVSDSELPEITVDDLQHFIFAYSDPSQLIDKTTESISFNLTGDGNMTWHPDLQALTQKIIGAPIASLDAIFNTDPGIVHARISLLPPWQSTLPKDLSRISVVPEK